MTDLKNKLSAKQKKLESKFNQLEEQRDKLVKQRSNIDRQIAVVAEEQVRLQGEFRAVEELLNEKDEPELKIPKKKEK